MRESASELDHVVAGKLLFAGHAPESVIRAARERATPLGQFVYEATRPFGDDPKLYLSVDRNGFLNERRLELLQHFADGVRVAEDAMEEGKWHFACLCLERLTDAAVALIGPGDGRTMLAQSMLATVVQWLGEFERAEELLLDVRDQSQATTAPFGSEYMATYQLGGLYQASGRWAQAQEAYQQATSLPEGVINPAVRVDTFNGLAMVQSVLGNQREALRSIDEIVRLWPDLAEKFPDSNAKVNTTQGIVAGRLGDYESALQHFERALSWVDSNRWYHGLQPVLGMHGGIVAEAAGRPEIAITYFALAVEFANPHTRNGRWIAERGNERLGSLYLQCGRFDEANKCFQSQYQLAQSVGNVLGATLGAFGGAIILHAKRKHKAAAMAYQSLIERIEAIVTDDTERALRDQLERLGRAMELNLARCLQGLPALAFVPRPIDLMSNELS